ncbi:hypothetical protein J6590_069679 [Homalodisca vitripennis]|nr:hypothetical protein J6590_069679 [Homalodisca vitripennis]
MSVFLYGISETECENQTQSRQLLASLSSGGMAGDHEIIKCLLQIEGLVHCSRSLATEPIKIFSPHPILINILSPSSTHQNPSSYSLPILLKPEPTQLFSLTKSSHQNPPSYSYHTFLTQDPTQLFLPHIPHTRPHPTILATYSSHKIPPAILATYSSHKIPPAILTTHSSHKTPPNYSCHIFLTQDPTQLFLPHISYTRPHTAILATHSSHKTPPSYSFPTISIALFSLLIY